MPPPSEKPIDPGLIWGEIIRCGWQPLPLGALEGGFRVQTTQGLVVAAARLFEAGRGLRLLGVDLGRHRLPGEEELFPRFLDMPLETRLLLGAARLAAQADHLLMFSHGRVLLYRLPAEQVECDIDSMRAAEEELLPALAAKARPNHEAVQPPGNPLEAAESLRGWLRHWSLRLADELQVAPEDCEKFIWKLVLMLQTSRKTGAGEAVGGWGIGCGRSDDGWLLSYDPLSTSDDFRALIARFESSFMTRIFSGDTESHTEWIDALEITSLAEQLRVELLMIAANRFEAETVTWLHARMEREQEGWRREIAGLPPVHRRLVHQGWMIIHPLVSDAARHGLGAMLRDFERLARYWDEYNAYRMRMEEEQPGRFISQPDLFFRLPRGVNARQHLTDGVNFIFSESMRVAGVPAGEEFGAGLVLLLKALDLARRLDWQFSGIDTLDRLWAPTS